MAVTGLRQVVGRYLFLEVARTWLIVAGVLFFLTLGLGFAKFIAAAAAGDLPVDTVLLLALYSAVENAGLVLPISVLLAALLTLGRLCRDNEFSALRAGGIGLATIYRPFIMLAILVALFAGALTLFVAPHTGKVMQRLTAETAAAALKTLGPGRFITLLDGDAVFYAAGRDEATGELKNVFIRVKRTNNEGQPVQTVVTAQRAIQTVDPDTGAQILVLKDGWRYEGRPGHADYRIIRFQEHGVRVQVNVAAATAGEVETMSTRALLASDQAAAKAQFQIRMAVPLSILILTLLALPLGRVPPRAGRYGRIIAGVLLYVVYFNLVHVTTIWVETGVLAAVVGAWSVHAAMLLLAAVLIMREQGVFSRMTA